MKLSKNAYNLFWIDLKGLVLVVLTCGVIGYGGMMASPYQRYLLTIAAIYALVTIGYQIIFGLSGVLSLAQGAFYGIGGYLSGLLALRYGWTFEWTVLAAIGVPVVIAVVAGAPILHLDSHYLALATLVLSQMALLIAVHWQDATGGANGLAGIPPLIIGEWTIEDERLLMGLAWGLVVIGGYGASRLKRSGLGLALAQTHADPLVAQCFGLPIVRLRLIALMVSAAYAGLGGALMVHNQQVISPEILEFPVMVSVLTMAVVGGRGSVAGAIVGAVFLIHAPEWFRGFEQAYLLWYGVLMLVVICFAPRGVMGLVEGIPWFKRPPSRIPCPRPLVLGSDSSQRSEPCLRIVQGVKSFGQVKALDRLTLTFPSRGITAIIGANGSGKTTLINVFSGIERLDEGRVTLFDHEITRASAAHISHKGVSRTFQALAVAEEWTVWDAVSVAKLPRLGYSRRRARREVIDILGAFDLHREIDTPLKALSTGHRQRVAIARALAADPKVLLLDEPTIGLTVDEQVLLRRILTSICSSMAVILIEHNIDFLRTLEPNAICLHQGAALSRGSFETVATDPAVRAVYFGHDSPR